MSINVRSMSRTIHRHSIGDRQVNGRYVCLTCPYRSPRIKNPKLGTIRPAYDFENKLLEISSLPHMTVPDLRKLALEHNLTGVSKMRKSDLVTLLTNTLTNEKNKNLEKVA